jgi:hypothetical protein
MVKHRVDLHIHNETNMVIRVTYANKTTLLHDQMDTSYNTIFTFWWKQNYLNWQVLRAKLYAGNVYLDNAGLRTKEGKYITKWQHIGVDAVAHYIKNLLK